ncbi:MAG: hypothetical protein HQM10_15700 [Candidatus Riflebacteria bacterium]|nr:hypothetical protein [Candidatus Riflebacteria bacterium]
MRKCRSIFLLTAIILLFSVLNAYSQDYPEENAQPPDETNVESTDPSGTDSSDETESTSETVAPSEPRTGNGYSRPSNNAPAPARSGFVPRWRIGDKWIIEATYRDLKSNGTPWLPPVQWVFHVKSIKELFRTNCYVLYIYPKNPTLKMQAVVYLSVADLRPIKIIDVFSTRSGVKFKQKNYDVFNPEPLLSEDSIIPYDLPTFPLQTSSTQEADGKGISGYMQKLGSILNFGKVSKVGPFRFKRSVKQTGKAPEQQYADAVMVYRNGGEAYQVEINDSQSSGGPLVQLWQQGKPWAISSTNWAKRVRFISQQPGNPGGRPSSTMRGGGR